MHAAALALSAAGALLACAPANAEPRSWTVAVVGDGDERCAGALVAPSAILTLAECVVGLDDVKVVIPVLWGLTLDLHVKRARVHPRFDPVGLKREDNPFNLALLDLDKAFPAPYRPVAIARLQDPSGQTLQAASYGLSRHAPGDKAAALSLAQFRNEGAAGANPDVVRLTPLDRSANCPNDRGAPVLREQSDGAKIVGLVTAAAEAAGRCRRGTTAILIGGEKGWIQSVPADWNPPAQAASPRAQMPKATP